jgi:P4 family phage/plasmid primase-like protien
MNGQTINSLENFLKSHQKQKNTDGVTSPTNSTYTHTRIGNKSLSIFGGTYNISDDNMEQFYKLYHQKVFERQNYEYLTEKQTADGACIGVDFDFRYSNEVSSRLHSSDHIIDMIELYLEKLKEIIIYEENVKFPIYIFEKPNINITDGYVKDGIHMIIGLKADHILQILLRDRVLKDLANIWEDLPITNTWDSVLDEGISKGHTNWQLYGSRKPQNEAYRLTQHYEAEYDPSDDQFAIDKLNVDSFNLKRNLNKLSIRYPDHYAFKPNTAISVEYETLKANKKKITKKKITKLKIKTIDTNEIDYSSIKNQDNLDEALQTLFDSVDTFDYHLKEVHDYALVLPEKYYGAQSYDRWIRVGWALKNTDEKLFLTWIKFSSLYNKFDYGEIPGFYSMWSNEFKSNNQDGLTKRSIMYWARNESPGKYMKVKLQTVDYYIEQTIASATEFDLATVLYHLYKDKFVCASIKHNIWYEYDCHRWLEIDSGSTLRMAISRELHKIYSDKTMQLMSDLQALDSGEEEWTIVQKKINRLSEICLILKRTQQKNNIMREARELFYDKNFINNMDSKHYLLCFKNGVIDFNESSLDRVLRNGYPEDNISKCTHIDYIPLDYTRDGQLISEVNTFMCQLFPVEDLRNYMWEHLASCLIGMNANQTFNIYLGKGRNGKSKLIELMSLILGDYKATVPITLITQKRTSIGSTSSEIVQLMGVRYAVMQEPSKGMHINEGVVKEITGGDPLQGRELYQTARTFVPQFKLVVCTNTLFEINSNDNGTWRRFREVDFMSKFTEKPVDNDPDEPYQYEVDKNMEIKFKKWKNIFMAMLVEKAFETKGNVQDCEIVTKATNKYRERQDYLAAFVSEKIRKEEGGRIRKTELYETFREWYTLQYGRNVPKGRDLYDHIEKKFGKCKNGWRNISIIYDADDEMEEINETNIDN